VDLGVGAVVPLRMPPAENGHYVTLVDLALGGG
jgi:hypothetical protein